MLADCLVAFRHGEQLLCVGIVSGDSALGGLIGFSNGTVSGCLCGCMVSGFLKSGWLVVFIQSAV